MLYTKLNNLRSFGLEVLEALTLSRWSGMICLFVLLCLGSVAKAEEYNLKIAGMQVTSDNAMDILSDGAASYDASSNTLTIKADITAPDNEKSCIEGEMDNLTIIVAANAKLSSTASAISITGKKTTITGDKTLTIVTPGKPSSFAIQNLNGDLCITNANLSLEGSLGCGLGKMSINHTDLSINGIIANFGGDVDITDSNVSVKSTNESAIHGSGGSLSIDNSSVSATTMASSTSAIAGWVSLETVCYLKIPQGGHYDTDTKKFIEADGNLAFKVEISPRFIEEGLYYDMESSNTVKLVSPTEGKYVGAITIPAVVKHNDVTYDVVAIGDDAFKGAFDVTSVTLPLTNLTSIGSYAFNDCTGLTEFTLPECITSIGERAFYYCDKLQHLYVHSSDPSSYHTGSMAFSKINKNCTLYVPAGTTAAYTADNSAFKAFTKVEEYTKYDLSVAGTLVTSLNASNVLGDGAASYDASKNTLSISGNITAPDAGTPCIKSGIKGLAINVSAPAELNATDEAIYLSKTATITGSSLLTISISSDDDQAKAIFQKDGDIYVIDANISAVGLMFCIGGIIDITNTTISKLGGIFCFSNDLNITKSTVSVNGIHGIGIVGLGALRIEKSTVNATIPDPSNSVIGLWGAVTLSNCYYKTPQGGYYDNDKTKRVLVDAEGNLAPTVEIVPGNDPYLYIAGKCVTSKNASDILGDGAASYDEDTKTLTISGDITAPDEDTPCISSGVDGLTIQVAVPAMLTATDNAVYLQGNTIITGSPKLTVSMLSDDGNATAIFNESLNLTITGTNLLVGGKICCPDGNLNINNSTLACVGDITGEGALYIEKSTVSATASDSEEPVIAGWKSLRLTGCSLLTPEGGRYNTENKMLEDANGDFASMVVISKGDASGDGKVDNDDITAIVNYIMTGKRDGIDIDNADLNGDGKVDLADLVLLINKIK